MNLNTRPKTFDLNYLTYLRYPDNVSQVSSLWWCVLRWQCGMWFSCSLIGGYQHFGVGFIETLVHIYRIRQTASRPTWH